MKKPSKAPRPVKSAQRIIDILEYFMVSRTPATLSALAAQMRLPISSCFALLRTLELNGYIYEVGPKIGYYPTRRWFDRGRIIAENDPLILKIKPLMNQLSEETRETLIFGKRFGHQVVYIEVVEWPQTLRYTASAGQFKPLHCTASGKAILAGMGAAERGALLDDYKFQKITPRTITQRSALEKELQAGMQRGWHVSRGENEPDTTAIAVPIVVANDVFVLAVGGVRSRIEKKAEKIGSMLFKAISKQQFS